MLVVQIAGLEYLQSEFLSYFEATLAGLAIRDTVSLTELAI
jgi:hypothetical protein